MRLWLASLLILCTAACGAGSKPALPVADDASGFAPLFNGKDLDGWVVAGSPEGFTVVDGCIHSDGGKGGEWIHTARQYGNFILRLEWMLSQVGNSGVFIRHGTPAGGFEVQLLAPWTPHRDDLHCTGSIYGHVPADPRPDETTLRWRQLEVSAVHQHIIVKLDGVKCCEADYSQVPSMKDLALVGYVGMQDSHTGPGQWVKFRNIEIEDLDRDPEFLAQGLAHEDPAVRRAAFEAALGLGAGMVGPLLDMIARGDPPQRHTAEMALARIVRVASAPGQEGQRDAARDALLARVGGDGGNAARDRVCVARLLGIIGEADPRTVAALTSAVLEGGPVSDAALEAMQLIPGRAMTEALIAAFREAEPSRQPAVLLALGARKDGDAVLVVGGVARRASGDLQLAAVRALGILGSARAIPMLRRAGAGAPDALRREVVAALLTLFDTARLYPDERSQLLAAARDLAVTDAQKAAVEAAH